MKKYLFHILLFFCTCSLLAANRVSVHQVMNKGSWGFLPNKGQLADENGQLLPDIKYYGRQGGVSIYFRQDMLSFVFSREEKEPQRISEATGKEAGAFTGKRHAPKNSTITANRADLLLNGANPHPEITASEEMPYYENYFLAHTFGKTGRAKDGITNVHACKTITYRNIYPHIDMVVHARDSGIKYEFVVYPGGRVSDIKLQWKGLNNMQLQEDGSISYALSLGEMKESRPLSLQNGHELPTTFSVHGNNTGFIIPQFDKSQPLTIDPKLVWGTYFGRSGEAYAVVTDLSGNVYLAGNTADQAIATKGAYQTSINTADSSYEDCYLAKFDGKDTLLWCTYYGGEKDDWSLALAMDKSGNVCMTGATLSKAGISTTGAYQASNAGYEDAFLAKFSRGGSLLWGTYFGGRGDEEALDIALDKHNNIFVSGSTSSDSGLATTGAYQEYFSSQIRSSGYYSINAFLAKFDDSGFVAWSTYYGKYGFEEGDGLAVDTSGNVFITGKTSSTSGLATPGAFKTYNSGYSDAYLAKFSNSGSIAWSTYYGGPKDDYGYALTTDDSGNVYMAGNTSSTSGIATSGSYKSTVSNPDGANFLSKFSSSGKLLWGTYYGQAGGVELPRQIVRDKQGNIYVAGYAENDSGTATPGAYQTKNVGWHDDAFFSKLSNNGALSYATYYGGSAWDEGYGIALDNYGNVYLAGVTESETKIATPGAHTDFHTGNGMTSFLVKFTFKINNDAAITSITDPVGRLCAGIHPVKAILRNNGLQELDSVKIGFYINNNLQGYYYWKGKLMTDSSVLLNLGNYSIPAGRNTLTVTAYLPNGITDSASFNDRASIIDTVNVYPNANPGLPKTICKGSSVTLGAASVKGDYYSWTSNPAGFTSVAANPTVTPDTTTTYYVTETVYNGGCNKTDSVKITVRPLPNATISRDTIVCKGSALRLNVTVTNADSGQKWLLTYRKSGSAADSTITGAGSGVFPFNTPVLDTTTVYSLSNIAETSGSLQCASPLTSKATVTVNQLPVAKLTGDTTLCAHSNAIIKLNVAKVASGQSWKLTYRISSSAADSVMYGTGSGSFSITTAPLDSAVTYTLISIAETSGKAQCSNSLNSKVTVNINSLPFAVISGDTSFCKGHDIAVTLPIVVSGLSAGQSWKISYRKTGSTADSFVTGKGNGTFYLHSSGTANTTSYQLTGITETSGSVQCSNSLSSKATITINPLPEAQWNLSYSGKTVILSATDSSLADTSYYWTLGDGSTAIGHRITHIFPKNTSYKIGLRITNAVGCTNTFDSIVRITSSGLAFTEQERNGVSIYPNPFDNITYVDYQLAGSERVQMTLYDFHGKEIASVYNGYQTTGSHRAEINATNYHLLPGVYLLKVILNNTCTTYRMVKL